MSEDIYRHKILDHYRSPRNFGVLKKATHTAGLQNISCGDSAQFYAIVEKGVIKKISFTGTGCAVSMASCSLLCERSEGEKLASAKKLTKKDVQRLLGIPISGGREKCAMLGLETMQKLEKTKLKTIKKN